jgi:hypothetical protein
MRPPHWAVLGAACCFTLASCSRNEQTRSSSQAAGTPCASKEQQTASTGAAAPAEKGQPVALEMHNVVFRDDPASVMRIRSFRGSLVPTKPGIPASFDEKHSFVFAIDSAVIATTSADMTALLNGSVFNYEHSPLTNIKLSTAGSKLKMNATLHKGVPVPIEMLGDLSVTPAGKLNIHADKVAALHIPMKKMINALDIQMADLIDPKYARGVSVEGNNMILDPQFVFPPPYKQGRLTKVAIEGANIVQTFGNAPSDQKVADSRNNYIRLRGGSVRFEKLEMRDADMTMIDTTPGDWFDFYLDHYREQLAHSDIKVTGNQALEVHMPDYNRIGQAGSTKQSQLSAAVVQR